MKKHKPVFIAFILGTVALLCIIAPFAIREYRAEVRFQSANRLREQGNYEKAIAMYSEAIAIKSTDDSFYNNRGMAFAQKGDYRDAINDFTEAIQIAPYYGLGYANRATAYHELGENEKAQSDLKTAKELRKNYGGP